jgi:hypothetical protein
MTAPSIWDDPFHAAAFTAFVALTKKCGGWPDTGAVKARAYELYEALLAEKDGIGDARRASKPAD